MKSTSTRASPAISMSRPRNTNSGTDSRMRFEVPSSMRLATMVSGTRVVSARYDTVAIPNAKAIGTPSATQTATMTTKKITRLRLPRVASMGWANHRPAPTMRMRAKRRRGLRRRRPLDQPRAHDHQHQHHADPDGGDAETVGNLQCRRGDERLHVHVVARRSDHGEQKDRHHHGGEGIDEAPEPHRQEADHEAEPHMFGPPQRDDGAQHGEPEEQRRGEFVRPRQRRIEHVTRDHAGQQHQDFDADQRGGGHLGGRGENPVEGSETRRRGVGSRRGHQALHRDGGFEATGHLQEWGRMRRNAIIGGRWSFAAH